MRRLGVAIMLVTIWIYAHQAAAALVALGGMAILMRVLQNG